MNRMSKAKSNREKFLDKKASTLVRVSAGTHKLLRNLRVRAFSDGFDKDADGVIRWMWSKMNKPLAEKTVWFDVSEVILDDPETKP